MAKKDITPSEFYFVQQNTTIERCIEIMQEKGLSFLLIRDARSKLVGIFTLKDLLKNFSHLINSKNLKKPIRVAMSRPVKTVPVHRIDKAAELMVRYKFRHLPVVSGGKERGQKIVGVIDMESLIKTFVEKEQVLKDEKKSLAIYSPDGTFLKLIKNAFKSYSLVDVDKLWMSKLKTQVHIISTAKSYDFLLFDLVDKKGLDMALTFAPFVERPKKIICALDSRQNWKLDERELIKKLNKYTAVRIFEKPINVHDLVYECF